MRDCLVSLNERKEPVPEQLLLFPGWSRSQIGAGRIILRQNRVTVMNGQTVGHNIIGEVLWMAESLPKKMHSKLTAYCKEKEKEETKYNW